MIWRLWCNHVVWNTLYHWRSRFHWIYHRDQRLQRINNVTFLENKSGGGNQSFLWSHWYRLDSGLVMSALSFKTKLDSLLSHFLTCMQWIPQIHLWCGTCWPASRPGLFCPLACKCISVLSLMVWYVLVYLWKQWSTWYDTWQEVSEGYNWICVLVICKVGFYCR